MTDEHTTDTGQDSGGRAHTGLDEGHPAGDGPRTDRQTGGPVAGQDAPEGEQQGGGKGTRPSPFEPHE